jgi:nitrous oxidase accessory protein
MVALAQTTGTSFAATVHVGSGERYLSIKDGVAAAAAGDTVLVHSGTYHEFGITVSVPIVLIGVGDPVINARDQGEILTVAADSVHVEGLGFRNVGTSFMEDRAAVRLAEVSGCTVTRCRLDNAFFGIYVEKGLGCTVSDNVIVGQAVRESTSGNGIHLWYCRDITVTGNEITGHRDGIYFEFVEDSHIEGNLSHGNLRYGLHFMFSHDDTYVDNTFIDNGAGVAVMYSQNVSMRGNRFERNWGSASYGLLLKDIRDSEILENTFYRNTTGIYAEGSNRMQVRRNEFLENGYGIKIMANSMDNVFTENNFRGNMFDVTTNSRQNFSRFHSNYWSSYRGYDLDRDGTGDVPHHPVRLFALIVEKQPPGMVLMNSLFVKIIDTAERVMPVFTPETLVDETPRIKAVVTGAR